MTVFKPIRGKPTDAFADGSWKDPRALGPLGKIRWDGFDRGTISPHAGVSQESGVTPISICTMAPTTTCEELAERFADSVVAGRKGDIYVRFGNKPSFELECAIAGMHDCGDGIVFASGMAAISHTLLKLVTAWDNIVVHHTLYGCTDELGRVDFPALGIETRFVDLRDPRILRRAINRRTRAVFFETPSNPDLSIIDIAAVAQEVRDRCPVIVDGTFASPCGQNPFDQGANLVVHSTTKIIAGHTDALGGVVLGSGLFMVHLYNARKNIGGAPSPRESSAVLKGIKTLDLRYAKMERNAIAIAELLLQHPEVERVFYPLFDERYPLNGQMKGPGYLISFILKRGLEGGRTFLNSLGLVTRAVSLGGVESLACHPASTTHSAIPREAREAKGISDGLVRLSVGTEGLQNLLDDIQQALGKVVALGK